MKRQWRELLTQQRNDLGQQFPLLPLGFLRRWSVVIAKTRRVIFFLSLSLERKEPKFKGKIIGLTHSRPKDLTFNKTCHKRSFVKVKPLVRLLGGHCPAFCPLPSRPSRPVFQHFGRCVFFRNCGDNKNGRNRTYRFYSVW